MCCTNACLCVEDSVERTARSDETSRPLLRMRWGRTTSPDEVKAALLEGGLCFRFASRRYTLSSEVGRGAHCVVWRCLRVSSQGEPRSFALKVHTEETSAFKREVAALNALDGVNSGGSAELFPRMLGSVRVHGRTGLAMPLYGPDLYQLQKQRERRPFPLDFVWATAAQLLGALEALSHAGLVHADIKPQNVVLHRADVATALNADTHITLIDLGSCLTTEQLRGGASKRITYVQSRWYRAPEVLLWAPVSHAADAWSVGCVIAEVAVGVPLLPGESEYNQLARITALLGPPPPSLLLRARRAEHFFVCGTDGAGPDGAGALLRTERARDEPQLVRYLPHDDLEDLLDLLVSEAAEDDKLALLLLLDGLLRLDPLERWCGVRLMDRLRAALEDQGISWSHPAKAVEPDCTAAMGRR
jgi:serine/threonine protein kinase